MRIVLADLKGRQGYVSKDTIAGGYGSRLQPFSFATRLYAYFKTKFYRLPSIQMAYLAAICAERGHEVCFTQEELPDGDVAFVQSSLIDFENELDWADKARQRGLKVGFVGLTASKLPQLFLDRADFVIQGEPESAVQRFAGGGLLEGICASEPIADLDTLPFPRWDLVGYERKTLKWMRAGARPFGGGLLLLASRSCPEFCTYCPHRILAGYRARSVSNILDEIEALCELYPRPHLVFRDPLFTERRDRCLELCEGIQARRLDLKFECETRLDRLDDALIRTLHAAGLRAISFGIETISPETLRKVARRPIPPAHQRAVVETCNRMGISTSAYFLFGFLQDNWDSIAATIGYAISLGSTFAQFKLLTPYPGTPLWKQLSPMIVEHNLEKYDGFTPIFRHPNLEPEQLRFLLAAAYARFYFRPSFLTNLLGLRHELLRNVVHKLDHNVLQRHALSEIDTFSRSVTC
jgi:anaerobic magnesium-protoporphyrin IX monomethyl ester cyclase